MLSNEDQWRWASEQDERNSPARKSQSNALPVKIKRLHADAVIPQYAREGDAGFDLVAVEDVIIEPGETALIKTGLAFELPQGYEMQVRPRSGVTLKTKLRVQLGTVDAGYRGEVSVIVDNICGIDEVAYSDCYAYLNGNYSEELNGEEYESNWEAPHIEFNVTYVIRKGDRIAQAVIKRVEHAQFIEVDTMSDTDRGEGGFGSSGVKHPEYFATPMGKELI